MPLSIGWPGLTLPLALPYWLEGGMVALQIVVWKASGGRRQLFGTAPLHRWLEKRGFDPVNIFYIFWSPGNAGPCADLAGGAGQLSGTR